MTPDELREAVARALVSPKADPSDWRFWVEEADAAIALIRAEVLEEAARVVTEHYQELCTEHRLLLVSRAAAIRALKEKSE